MRHKEKLLDNDTRNMILEYVRAHPGTHHNEIIHRLSLANGEAAYHLGTLEREGFVKSLSDGRLKMFYPAEMDLLEIPSRLEPVQRIIYEAIKQREGMGQREIARALKLPRSTVNRHINRLARLGVLRLERQRFTVRCYVTVDPSPKEPGP
jgi:predicted transcriptional regulator